MLCYDSYHGPDGTEYNRSQGHTRHPLGFRGEANRGVYRGCGSGCNQDRFVNSKDGWMALFV